MYDTIKAAAEEMRGDVISFTQKLVQTPSTSGEEGQLAQLTVDKMVELGYDKVFVDDMGNVVGIIKGSGERPNIMYNSHMDHVDPGNEANWEYPPYGAVIADGFIHGRAASDVKGGMATQIYAGALLKKAGIRLKGDFIYTGVVQEEPAEMFGMKYLCEKTLPSKNIAFGLMVSSEATSLNLYLGHRGRVEMEVVTKGRTSHGSAPWLGVNAVYQMMPVIEEVQKLAEALPAHDFLGKATIALTIISCSPGRLSIIPDVCTVSLDRRLIPGETAEQVVAQVQQIIDRIKEKQLDFIAEVGVRKVLETSYKGYVEECQKYMNPWSIPQDHPCVVEAVQALQNIGQNPGYGKWDFGTDASYVTGVLNIPTIGYSPMEEKYAHTPYDRVNIEYLVKSVAGNAAIAYHIAG